MRTAFLLTLTVCTATATASPPALIPRLDPDGLPLPPGAVRRLGSGLFRVGNPDIVRAGIDGLLFPRADAAGCAACFVKLFTSPDLLAELGANARRRAQDKYRLTDTIAAYDALYRRFGGG